MVAVVPPLLSDHPPELPQKAGLGDRFHYFRGRSGRRYLFSVVPDEALADFRNAVAILAEPVGRGRLSARTIVALDACGRPALGDGPWPPLLPPGTLGLVHLLAASERDRSGIVADLAAMPLRLAA